MDGVQDAGRYAELTMTDAELLPSGTPRSEIVVVEVERLLRGGEELVEHPPFITPTSLFPVCS